MSGPSSTSIGSGRWSLDVLRLPDATGRSSACSDGSCWPASGEGEPGDKGPASVAVVGERSAEVRANGDDGLMIESGRRELLPPAAGAGGGRLNEKDVDRLVGETPQAGRGGWCDDGER